MITTKKFYIPKLDHNTKNLIIEYWEGRGFRFSCTEGLHFIAKRGNIIETFFGFATHRQLANLSINYSIDNDVEISIELIEKWYTNVKDSVTGEIREELTGLKIFLSKKGIEINDITASVSDGSPIYSDLDSYLEHSKPYRTLKFKLLSLMSPLAIGGIIGYVMVSKLGLSVLLGFFAFVVSMGIGLYGRIKFLNGKKLGCPGCGVPLVNPAVHDYLVRENRCIECDSVVIGPVDDSAPNNGG